MDRLNVIQIREGFATNSSSSHSLIYVPEGVAVRDNEDPDQYFGWSWFTLASQEAKARYAVQCFKNFDFDVLERIFGVRPEEDGYIDHESVGLLGFAGSEEDLVDVLNLYVNNPQVVILGGNDNDDQAHPDESNGVSLPGYRPGMTWRHGDNYSVIFYKESGLKVHLSNTPGVKMGQVPGEFPELVDLKISDYCTLGCPFCYQNSTARGKHADLSYLFRVVDDLAKLGTFEIAIGGGEPLQFPQMLELVTYIHSKGIVPNFTTKLYRGLAENSQLFDYIGGVAMSVANVEDTRRAIEACFSLPSVQQNKVSFQIPVGAQTKAEFCEIIRMIGESTLPSQRVTLLGYKQVGRGPNTTYHSFEDSLREAFQEERTGWMDSIYWADSYPRIRIGIDTQLAAMGSDIIDMCRNPDLMVMRKEGLLSCYIDGVSQTIAPSSYCDSSLYLPLKDTSQIGDIFHEISTAACEESIRDNAAGSTAIPRIDSDNL